MTDQATVPAIAIKRIKEQSFQIREDLLTDPSRPIKIEIGQSLGIAAEAGLVDLTLRIYYHFVGEPQPILVDISVQNVYEISNLQRYFIDSGEFKLPPVTITNIVGLSISHTRALLAKELFGTIVQDNLPYIVDPTEVAMHFFPRMFELEGVKVAAETPMS